MSIEDLFNTEKQLAHWEDRRDELEKWLINSDPLNNENWEQNRRDLNVAITKIEQLKARGKKPNQVHTHIYSLPKS